MLYFCHGLRGLCHRKKAIVRFCEGCSQLFALKSAVHTMYLQPLRLGWGRNLAFFSSAAIHQSFVPPYVTWAVDSTWTSYRQGCSAIQMTGLAALEQGLSEVESYVCSPVYDLVEPLYPCITAQHSFPDGHNMVFLPLGHHHLGVAINTPKVDKSSLELEVLCAFVLRYNYVHPCKLIQRVCMLMKSRGLYARIFATQKRLNSQNISREMLCSSQIECAPHVCV